MEHHELHLLYHLLHFQLLLLCNFLHLTNSPLARLFVVRLSDDASPHQRPLACQEHVHYLFVVLQVWDSLYLCSVFLLAHL